MLQLRVQVDCIDGQQVRDSLSLVFDIAAEKKTQGELIGIAMAIAFKRLVDEKDRAAAVEAFGKEIK